VTTAHARHHHRAVWHSHSPGAKRVDGIPIAYGPGRGSVHNVHLCEAASGSHHYCAGGADSNGDNVVESSGQVVSMLDLGHCLAIPPYCYEVYNFKASSGGQCVAMGNNNYDAKWRDCGTYLTMWSPTILLADGSNFLVVNAAIAFTNSNTDAATFCGFNNRTAMKWIQPPDSGAYYAMALYSVN
jgi:hypothetical protein